MPKSSLNSTLTDRYQTTIPEAVRQQLGLRKRDKLEYQIQNDGSVKLTRARPEQSEQHDPALGAFLDLLERDIKNHPERLRAADTTLLARIDAALDGFDLDIDINAKLDPEDE